MKIKKILLLASMSLAAIAFAAPAAAQAETFWASTGALEASGNITWVRAGFATGPINTTLGGTVENGEEMGEGSITSAAMEGVEGGEVIPTNLPGCTAVGTSSNFPWSITLTTPDTIDISGMTFTLHYFEGGAPGCPKFGIPSTIPISGTVTGTVEGKCFNLEPYGDDLHVEGTGEAPPTVNLKGSNICGNREA